MPETLLCPWCEQPLTHFTFFRCEPTMSLGENTLKDGEEHEEELEPAVAVRCDQCHEFLAHSLYRPLREYLEAFEAAALALRARRGEPHCET